LIDWGLWPAGRGTTVGEILTLNDAPIVRELRELVGELTDDEAALVRALTPPELARNITVEHLCDLADLVATVRTEESVADYIYAIAPNWDGAIDALVLGARVTTMLVNVQLTRRVLAAA
jgi:hypothetical protein